jgi:hypothetical protein
MTEKLCPKFNDRNSTIVYFFLVGACVRISERYNHIAKIFSRMQEFFVFLVAYYLGGSVFVVAY